MSFRNVQCQRTGQSILLRERHPQSRNWQVHLIIQLQTLRLTHGSITLLGDLSGVATGCALPALPQV